MKKVGQVFHLAASDIGGINKSMLNIARALQSCGVKNTFVSPVAKKLCDAPGDCIYMNLDYGGNSSFGLFPRWQGFDDLLRTESCQQLWLVHGQQIPVLINAVELLIRHRVRFVIVPHGQYNEAYFRRSRLKKLLFWYLLTRRQMERAAAILHVGERQYNWYLPFRVPAEISVPLPIEPFGETAEKDLSDPPVIVYFGRINSYVKGLDILVASLKEFSPTQLQVVIQGDDEFGEAAQLILLARSYGHEIKLLPYEACDGQLIASRYDGVILPSRLDHFPVTIAESMAAGKFVLVSSANNIAQYVQEAGSGLVFDPNVESLTQALRQALAISAQWKVYGKRGRQYVASHWSPNAIGAKLLAQLESLD